MQVEHKISSQKGYLKRLLSFFMLPVGSFATDETSDQGVTWCLESFLTDVRTYRGNILKLD